MSIKNLLRQADRTKGFCEAFNARTEGEPDTLRYYHAKSDKRAIKINV